MTREELKKEVGLILEDFDGNPNKSIKSSIEEIVDIANSYIKIELVIGRKKLIVDYLKEALNNVW